MNIRSYILFCICIVLHNFANAQFFPLYIPPTLNGPVYNLNMQHGTHQFSFLVNSASMGFNGNVLGPTLIMQAGQQVSMNVTNSIGEATTVHWHGFHVAPENDGGPHTVIEPNTTWTPSFPVLDKAGTYWYHPHLHDSTTKHVLKGLAGMIIVKDAEEAALSLPRTYGVDDFPLIIQTKSIDADGTINYQGQNTNSDTKLMVNATPSPRLNVPQQYVRFRILNASLQRVFNIGLSNGFSFFHIATDGGLKATRTSVSRLRLAPGERGEIVVPFNIYSVGTNLQLVSYAGALPNGTFGATNAWLGGAAAPEPPGYTPNFMNGTTFNILGFTVVAPTTTPTPILSIPSTLATVTPIPEASATVTRNKWFFAGGDGAGGVKIGNSSNPASANAFSLTTIDDVIPLNSTEIWTLHGSFNMYHPFHIHDIQFYILDRRDSNNNIIPLTSNEIGRKDVVYVGPKETVRFITKFDDFWSDVPYMYHCHITIHEDRGMMKQFIVTRRLYVDKNYSGPEFGTITFPYNTLREAVNAATDGTTIYFKSNGIHEELTTDLITTKKLTFKVTTGNVTVK